MAESRCVQNLQVLASDKSVFKDWNDKLLNTMSATMGTEWRNYMYNLNQKLDTDRKVLDDDQLERIEGYDKLQQVPEVNENLYYVLVEKTQGEALNRVRSGIQGQGVRAYMRVYLWFSCTTGQALAEKMCLLMAPKVTLLEHELAENLEQWSELGRTMKGYGEEYTLKPVHKVSALRTIMTCKREQYEHMERETKAAHDGKITEEMFDDLYQKVREYTQQRRLEELNKSDPNRMMVGGVGGTQTQAGGEEEPQ